MVTNVHPVLLNEEPSAREVFFLFVCFFRHCFTNGISSGFGQVVDHSFNKPAVDKEYTEPVNLRMG